MSHEKPQVHYVRECRSCEQGYHNDCSGKCPMDGCDDPCSCDCRHPLTNDERYRLRKLARAMGRD